MLRHLVALAAALVLGACGLTDAPSGEAEFVGAWTFHPKKEWQGGFSGIDSPDGRRFALTSDQGYFVIGRFRREGGRIAGFDQFRVHEQKRPKGLFRKADRDAEGLVWDGGTLFVSRERVHEVWRFDSPGAVPAILPRHPDFVGFRFNESMEALAQTADGVLLTLPERPHHGVFPLYRFEAGAWRRSAMIPASDGFRAVGADVGPDGWLYLLERRYRIPFFFSSRVRRFRLEGDEIMREETLLVSAPGQHDNLEGLTVWQEPGGDVRLTMVSDDNFLQIQKTEFVEYRVPPPLDRHLARG